MLNDINVLPLSDAETYWESISREDCISSRFTPEQWEYIMGKDFSEEMLFDFLENFPFYIKSYTYKRRNGKVLAFVYIVSDVNAKNVVYIHGGGCSDYRTHYKGYIMMIEALLGCKLRIRTKCALANDTAIRFDRSVGFVPYRYSDVSIYMWINKKRLQSSKIYKYFIESDHRRARIKEK